MGGLRTVTVLEHEVIPVFEGDHVPGISEAAPQWLSEAEAQALLRLNDLRRGFCQRLSGGIKLAQHCGIVRLPTCVVEVLPKVGMGDARTADELERSRGALLAMLHSARQVAITKIGSAPQQAVRAPLLDIFIEAFLHCALEQARRGLISRYVAHADDFPVIKGRFQAHGHVRRNLARPHLLHCEHDEFTTDNAYNRAVRATLNACRTWLGNGNTQRLWFETHARYASISSVRMSAKDVASLPRDRTTHRYAPLLTWCEWILAMASPAMSAGATQAPGLLFDMNKLFEAHVAKREEDAAGPDQIVRTQGPPMHLAVRGATGVFLLKPDITVWRVGQNGAASSIDRVFDAKWKRLNPAVPDYGVDEADVYQLLAYAMRYGCSALELVYPMPDGLAAHLPPPAFKIMTAGDDQNSEIVVTVKLIPLWTRDMSTPSMQDPRLTEAETEYAAA
ncbi:McrC family protein [Hydrogenophaga sp.]|jgi:5-methylcytosine-specific restriction enzyme subunit McrC|uniref:McrC family protein n=1 Tax=Hydrogenophaga sp. TaxID=1904254 RepID=UPI00271E01C7|nr:restriction endonuclease [Hydrogenophaga sp.]MDO9604410.1 restriction endonuclease [Hydrogenophaga sp.]